MRIDKESGDHILVANSKSKLSREQLITFNIICTSDT